MFSQAMGWVDLLTHGAPKARFARQSSAMREFRQIWEEGKFKLSSLLFLFYEKVLQYSTVSASKGSEKLSIGVSFRFKLAENTNLPPCFSR